MKCKYCDGRVEWQGKLTDLTHTLCLDCGARDSQEEESTEANIDGRENEGIYFKKRF